MPIASDVPNNEHYKHKDIHWKSKIVTHSTPTHSTCAIITLTPNILNIKAMTGEDREDCFFQC